MRPICLRWRRCAGWWWPVCGLIPWREHRRWRWWWWWRVWWRWRETGARRQAGRWPLIVRARPGNRPRHTPAIRNNVRIGEFRVVRLPRPHPPALPHREQRREAAPLAVNMTDALGSRRQSNGDKIEIAVTAAASDRPSGSADTGAQEDRGRTGVGDPKIAGEDPAASWAGFVTADSGSGGSRTATAAPAAADGTERVAERVAEAATGHAGDDRDGVTAGLRGHAQRQQGHSGAGDRGLHARVHPSVWSWSMSMPVTCSARR